VGSIPFFSNPVTVNGATFDELQTTDPGMGLITGKCADLGKFKVPRLNGLAARAPYFHNGNAATLQQLVEFYNARFNMSLSSQEKQDLINFLNSL
jgi:cytochrome c peroxidase